MILLVILLLPLIVTFIAPSLRPRRSTYLSSFAFLVSFSIILYCIFKGISLEVHLIHFPAPVGEFYIFSDPISNAFGLIICLISAMVAFFALPYIKHRLEDMELNEGREFKKYIFLYDFFAVSMLWLVYSGNLILLYIFLEVLVIFAFFMIYFYGYEERRGVSILYFVWMIAAGVLTLVGFLLIAFDNSTVALKGLSNISIPAWAFVFFGMIIKFPCIGLHIWIPRVYAEGPTPPIALLPLADGLAAYILLRLYLLDPSFIVAYRIPILVYAIISSIYAGFAVFKQTDFKRLLSYSSISQMGYMLIALCLGSYGLMGMVIQYLSHSLGKSILLMVAGGIIALYNLRDIGEMGGLHDYMPPISNAACVGFMNLGGILTVGMFGEFFILRGVIETFGWNLGVILPVVFVFMLSVWYGFYFLKKIFYGSHASPSLEMKSISGYLYIPLFIIAFFSVLFLFPPISTQLVIGLKSIILGGVVP